ncbi:MAG: hypothetical protein IJ731_03690 [Eubacterium sp.]|nr:hypothetical protein [Eubacterium sp.]
MNNMKSYRPRIKCPACGSTLLQVRSKEIKNATTAVLITDNSEITGDLIIRCKCCKNDVMLNTDIKKVENSIFQVPIIGTVTA